MARYKLTPWLIRLASITRYATRVTLALAVSAAAALSAAAFADELKPFQASYLWVWHGAAVALSTLDLEHRGDDNWVYTSSSVPRGLGHLYPMHPHLQSVMRITAQGVLPQSFRASGSGSAHDADVKFDWDKARATGTYEGTKLDVPIKPGVQDDLSVQIAMLLQLQQGKTPEQTFEINKDSVREYDYARVGEQMLDTPIGKFDTVIYSSHHPGSPRTTRFWCAPAEGYVPLQVQQRLQQHGDESVEWSMQIRSLKR